MTKYLLIKYLLGLLVVFSLTFPSIAGCPTKVSEEQFDEINKSVMEEHLPETLQNCKARCTYHAEASVYLMRHGGTAPVEGFEFFPKQSFEIGEGRYDIETAISYMSMSDEKAIKINGVIVDRAELLAEKSGEINLFDDKQRITYATYLDEKFGIPPSLDVGNAMPVSNFPVINVIDELNEIEDNEPFVLSVVWETPSGKISGHSMPAMRYIEPGTGIKKIRIGMQIGDSQEIIYKDLSSLKSRLIEMMSSEFNVEVKLIERITIMQPL